MKASDQQLVQQVSVAFTMEREREHASDGTAELQQGTCSRLISEE